MPKFDLSRVPAAALMFQALDASHAAHNVFVNLHTPATAKLFSPSQSDAAARLQAIGAMTSKIESNQAQINQLLAASQAANPLVANARERASKSAQSFSASQASNPLVANAKERARDFSARQQQDYSHAARRANAFSPAGA